MTGSAAPLQILDGDKSALAQAVSKLQRAQQEALEKVAPPTAGAPGGLPPSAMCPSPLPIIRCLLQGGDPDLMDPKTDLKLNDFELADKLRTRQDLMKVPIPPASLLPLFSPCCLSVASHNPVLLSPRSCHAVHRLVSRPHPLRPTPWLPGANRVDARPPVIPCRAEPACSATAARDWRNSSFLSTVSGHPPPFRGPWAPDLHPIAAPLYPLVPRPPLFPEFLAPPSSRRLP